MIKPYRGTLPQIHESVYLAESAVVIGDVVIGEESSVWFNTTIRGDVHFIRIGARANIQDGTVIHVTNGKFSTTIEDEVTVGHNATIHGCYIEQGSLIGMGAIVLDGARIGAQSLVGAGALVTPGTIVPPRSLVVGSPARVKRELTEEEIASLEVYWRNYVAYSREYMSMEERG